MANQDIKAIRAAINSSNAGWEAQDNAFTALSDGEKKELLGLVVDEAELNATAAAIANANQATILYSAFAAPAAVDWRNNGGNFVTPIRDQQSCGSCVSFATCATFEARLNIACRTPGQDRNLSEADLFYCGCGNCCGTGWNFPPALDYCRNTGVAPESAFPYTPGNQPCRSGLTGRTRITSWTSLLAIAERKDVIARKGPVVAGMAVYQDFYAYRTGVYRHVTGSLVGYHAISVVGYEDTPGCWIAKNSWGPGWGDGGFFRIAYGDCGIDTSFAFYDMEVACPGPPTSSCELHLPYLRKVLVVARQNRLLRACLLFHVCRRGLGMPPRCTPQVMLVVRRVHSILARCPQYRASFCRALASA